MHSAEGTTQCIMRSIACQLTACFSALQSVVMWPRQP